MREFQTSAFLLELSLSAQSQYCSRFTWGNQDVKATAKYEFNINCIFGIMTSQNVVEMFNIQGMRVTAPFPKTSWVLFFTGSKIKYLQNSCFWTISWAFLKGKENTLQWTNVSKCSGPQWQRVEERHQERIPEEIFQGPKWGFKGKAFHCWQEWKRKGQTMNWAPEEEMLVRRSWETSTEKESTSTNSVYWTLDAVHYTLYPLSI